MAPLREGYMCTVLLIMFGSAIITGGLAWHGRGRWY
jgi:hypothetical protein